MRTYLLVALTGLHMAALQAQQYPAYEVPVPEQVILNHSCYPGNVSHYTSNYINEARANFMDVVNDAAGNIYFLGVSTFPDNQPSASAIHFGTNTPSPQTFTRQIKAANEPYDYFLAKFSPNGVLQWVNFFTEPPLKMQLDENENAIYLTFNKNGNGLGIQNSITGVTMPPDSSYCDNTFYVFNLTDGTMMHSFRHQYLHDLVFAGNKKILVYRRMYTSTNIEIRYGFINNHQITKWQTTLNGTTQLPNELLYNPYQNTIWYSHNKMQYYRLFLHTSGDSLIAENISRPLYYSFTPPYNLLNAIKKFHFLPDGNYLGEYYGNFNDGYRPQFLKIDTAGNVLWKISFLPGGNYNQPGYYHLAIQSNGDIWIDIPTTGNYFNHAHFEPSDEKFFINPYGNIGIYDAGLWKINGQTGTLDKAYFKGYGTVNSPINLSDGSGNLLGSLRLLYVTQQNKLITNPNIVTTAYFPDENGNFKPYFTSCDDNKLPEQFLWVSYDLNDLKAFKKEEADEQLSQLFENKENEQKIFTAYPNPFTDVLHVISNQAGEFELWDVAGKHIETLNLEAGKQMLELPQLQSGVYLLKSQNLNKYIKIVRQ